MIISRNIFLIYLFYIIIGIKALEEQSMKLKAFEDAVQKAKEELESIKTAFGIEDGNERERRGSRNDPNYNHQPTEYIIDRERKYRNYNHNNDESTEAFERKCLSEPDDIEDLARKWKAANLLTIKNPKNSLSAKNCFYNTNNPKVYKQLIKLTNSNDNESTTSNKNRKILPPVMEIVGGKGGKNKIPHISNLNVIREKTKTCGKVFVDADFLKDNLNKEYDEQKQRNDDNEDEDDYDNIDAYGLYVPSVPDVSCTSKYKLNEPVLNKQSKYHSKDNEAGNGADDSDEIGIKPKKYMFREGKSNVYIPQGWLYHHNGNRKPDDDSDNLSGVQLVDQKSYPDMQMASLSDNQPMNNDDMVSRAALSTPSQINHLINDDVDTKSYLYRSPTGMPLNDQFETDKNNLSHEANYKLSKIEQDASEGMKGFITKWGDVDKIRRSSGFNPMNEIKLKTSQRLMTKGYGPSLPSYSLSDNRNEMLIEHVLQKKEEQISVDHDDYRDNENDGSALIGDASYNTWMGLNRYPMDALNALSDDIREGDSTNITDAWQSFYPNSLNYVRQKRISNEKPNANLTSLENSNGNVSCLLENDNNMSAIVRNVLLSLNNRNANRNVNATSGNKKKPTVNLQKKWLTTKDVPGDRAKAENMQGASNTKLKDSGTNDQSSNQPLVKDKDNSKEDIAQLNENNYEHFENFKTEGNNQKHNRRKRSIFIKEDVIHQNNQTSKENPKNNNLLNTTLTEGQTVLQRSRRSAQLSNDRINDNPTLTRRSLFNIDRTQGLDNDKGILPPDHGQLNFLSVIERKKDEVPTDYDNQKQKDLKLEKYNNMKFDNLEWNRDDGDAESMPLHNTKENDSNDPNHKFSINFDIPQFVNLNRFHKNKLRNTGNFNNNLKSHNMNYWPNDHGTHQLRPRNANEPNPYDPYGGAQLINDNQPNWVDNKMNSKTNSRLDLHRWMHNLNRAVASNSYDQKSINTREDNAVKQHANGNLKELQLSKSYPNSNNKANMLDMNLNLGGNGNGGGGGSPLSLMRNTAYPKSANLDAGQSEFFLRQYPANGIETTIAPMLNGAPTANMSKNCTEDMTTCIPICNPNYVTMAPNNVMNTTGNDIPTTSEHSITPTSTTTAYYTTPNTTVYYSTTTSTEYPMEGIVSSTPNPLAVECPEQPNDSNECNDFGVEEIVSNNTSPEDNEVKINININAKISGQGNQKIICTNDSANYVSDYTEDRDRRQILLPSYEQFNKRNADDEDYKNLVIDIAGYENDEEMNNLASGKLSSHVVKSVLNRVKDNPKLRLLWPSFKYMKIEDRPALVTDLYALRTPETNEKVDDSEKMLRLALDAINTLVDEQVRSHTCVPLRPDLQKFYEMILKSKEQKDYDAPRNKRHNDDKRLYLEDLDDSERIEQKSKVVKKLLKQYEELPQEDQQQVIDIRDDLLEDLVYLRKLRSTQERKKREAIEAQKMQVALANDRIMKRLESQYSPQFLRLLKASDLYYEILPDSDRSL